MTMQEMVQEYSDICPVLTLVSKERSLTCSALAIRQGSESSQVTGTVAALSAYTSRSKAQVSFSSGRKVTEAVIWRMMAWISWVISFRGLSEVADCPLLLWGTVSST